VRDAKVILRCAARGRGASAQASSEARVTPSAISSMIFVCAAAYATLVTGVADAARRKTRARLLNALSRQRQRRRHDAIWSAFHAVLFQIYHVFSFSQRQKRHHTYGYLPEQTAGDTRLCRFSLFRQEAVHIFEGRI